jgi:DnaJ-domain-containing protein 1
MVILLALARVSPALGTSMLLAGTMGDIRVVRKVASKISTKKPDLLRRTLRRVSGQIIVLALVLLDIGSFGFVLAAPVWLAPWVIMNLTVLGLGALSWSEAKRIQAERRLDERQREAQRQQEAERLRLAEQQVREAEQRRRQQEEEHEAQRQQHAEQVERLRQTEQRLSDVEQLRAQEEEEHEALRQQHAEQVERLRQTEQQLRQAEWRRRQEEREAQRKGQREPLQAGTQFQGDWWIVLGVAPSASKDEIVRNYRHRIKQYHPDRVIGLAPEFLQLAEERTKALNEAYENAMRRWLGAA